MIYILIAAIAAGAAGVSVSRSGGRVCASGASTGGEG
jgi:hypothetical protein